MSIQNAMVFTEIYKREEKLRKYLSSLDSAEAVRSYIEDLELQFTDEEFEEAYNLQVVKCKDEEDHSILTQVKMSYIELVRR